MFSTIWGICFLLSVGVRLARPVPTCTRIINHHINACYEAFPAAVWNTPFQIAGHDARTISAARYHNEPSLVCHPQPHSSLPDISTHWQLNGREAGSLSPNLLALSVAGVSLPPPSSRRRPVAESLTLRDRARRESLPPTSGPTRLARQNSAEYSRSPLSQVHSPRAASSSPPGTPAPS